jgi:hypothetical protein
MSSEHALTPRLAPEKDRIHTSNEWILSNGTLEEAKDFMNRTWTPGNMPGVLPKDVRNRQRLERFGLLPERKADLANKEHLDLRLKQEWKAFYRWECSRQTGKIFQW